MNFIKKCREKNFDELVHLQFQKFSKGEFRNRAIIEAKRTGKKITLNTSSEFANELVRLCAEKLGENSTNVSGAIISTMDLKGKIDFKEIKQFQGVKKYVLEQEMTGKKILDLLKEFPKNFFALTFSVGDYTLKIKPKAPKSGKPGKGDESPKPDFCKLITTDNSIAQDLIFEKPDFKKAEINHTFFIEEIVIPDELKDSKDFAKIRECSRRKGKIIRKAKIDEREFNEEIFFEA